MLPKQLILCGIIHLFVNAQVSISQCVAPASPPESSLTDPIISNGETLANGTTKWYKNTGTLSSLTINGGTFIVEGNLSINSLTFNSGEIIIMPGASLSITSDNLILQGNAKIFNYGYFYVFGHIYMMGATTASTPNCIVNASPAATITSPANSLYIMSPNSTFTNNGKANFGWMYTGSSTGTGSIVLNDGSETSVMYIDNNKENSIVAPSGKACVSVTTSGSRVSKTITSSPNLKLVFTGSANCNSCTATPWGDAEIFTSTPSCASIKPLAVHLSNFTINRQGNCNTITWQTNTTEEQTVFILEHSTNGISYKEHTQLKKQGDNLYRVKDCAPAEGTNYYRIKTLNKQTNTIAYSEVKSIKNTATIAESIYPNPFVSEFTITQLGTPSSKSTGTLRNSLGQQIPISINKQPNSVTVRTAENLNPGIYFFQLTTDAGTINYRLVKK